VVQEISTEGTLDFAYDGASGVIRGEICHPGSWIWHPGSDLNGTVDRVELFA